MLSGATPLSLDPLSSNKAPLYEPSAEEVQLLLESPLEKINEQGYNSPPSFAMNTSHDQDKLEQPDILEGRGEFKSRW